MNISVFWYVTVSLGEKLLVFKLQHKPSKQGNYLFSNTASHSGRLVPSTPPLKEPQISRGLHPTNRCKITAQDKSLAPHIHWSVCAVDLGAWLNRKRNAMPFVAPMGGGKGQRRRRWRRYNCSFCIAEVSRQTSKNQRTIKHLKMPSAVTSVPHSKELPVNKIPESLTIGDDDEMGLDNREQEVDDTVHDKKYIKPDSANPI